MAQKQSGGNIQLTRFGWFWLVVIVMLAFGGWVAGRFNNATELAPLHDGTYTIWCGAAAVIGLVSVLIGFFQSRGGIWIRILVSVISFGGIGAIGASLLVLNTADIVWMAIDFPPAKTKTFTGNLLISRAYRTHGKSAGWNIQTTPLWSDLNITASDYDFMLAHRRPGDPGTDPDEISSRGYFCAKVTLQSSGNAVRVLHAGNGALPMGTVDVCPPGVKSAIQLARP